MTSQKWSHAASSVLILIVATHYTFQTNFAKLQWSQTILACIVTGHNRSDHITPVIADLHWLQIQNGVEDCVTEQTYSICKSGQPGIFQKLIPEYKLTRDLWSLFQDLIDTKAQRLTEQEPSCALLHRSGTVYPWQRDIMIQSKLFENT